MKRMVTVERRVRLRYATFIALALLINIVDGMLIRSEVDARRQFILALAASCDVILVVAALYYWLLVRPGARTNASMIAVVVLAIMRAALFFPTGSVKLVIAGLAELGIIATVVISARQVRISSRNAEVDPVEAIRTAVRNILPLPIAVNLLTAELAILYYALFSWRARPHIPANTQAFTIYKKVGQVDLLSVLPVACVFEMIPVHLLLGRWNTRVAWAATAVSAYGLIWLVGLARSFPLRPTLVARNGIHIRYGLLFHLEAPRALILRAGRALANSRQFAVPRRSEPTHYIEFSRELIAGGLFGLPKQVSRVALTIDDQAAFERALLQNLE